MTENSVVQAKEKYIYLAGRGFFPSQHGIDEVMCFRISTKKNP